MKPFENYTCLEMILMSIQLKLDYVDNGVSERFSDFCDAPITELISKYLLK